MGWFCAGLMAKNNFQRATASSNGVQTAVGRAYRPLPQRQRRRTDGQAARAVDRSIAEGAPLWRRVEAGWTRERKEDRKKERTMEEDAQGA